MIRSLLWLIELCNLILTLNIEMMTNKNYFLFLSMIGLIAIQSLFSSHVLASNGNNYYDEIEATFTIPNATSPAEYILPILNKGESYMIKTLGATKVNDLMSNSGEINEFLILNNEVKVIWNNNAENRAISVYKFKDGNAIMAMGAGGSGLCDEGYINSETPLTEVCPGDWVKITWHRNTQCSFANSCGNNRVRWITQGISEISINACGGLPNPNDPNTYFSNLPTGPAPVSSSSTITCGSTKMNGKECKEIWVKIAMTQVVRIKGSAGSCGTFCGTMSATLTVLTGFATQTNFTPVLPYPDNNISISGNSNLPCASQNFNYSLNGMQGYSHLPLSYNWTLSNPNWTIVSGQGTLNPVINTNGSPGSSTLKALITTYAPSDCRSSWYEEEITINRNYSNIQSINSLNYWPSGNNDDFCENRSKRFYVSSNPQSDPSFVGYTWKISSPTGASRIRPISGGPKVTYYSGTNPGDPYMDIFYEMEDNVTIEARYEYTCGSGPWLTNIFSTQPLPTIPTGINIESNNPFCSNRVLEFSTDPISNFTYIWTANPGANFTYGLTSNEIEFASNQIPNFITSLDLSVSAENDCGVGPSFNQSFPFNQPAQMPQLDIPDCFERGTQGTTPNRLEVTNPEIGITYTWQIVPYLNGNFFNPPPSTYIDPSNTSIANFGLDGRFMDELYINVLANGCVGINPEFELTINDPTIAPEGGSCIEDEESKKGIFANIINDEIKIYPNPSVSSFSIITSAIGKKHTVIYDINGSKIDEFEFDSDLYDYNSSNLKSGVYVIKVRTVEREYHLKVNVL
jgi:hypothetical protein